MLPTCEEAKISGALDNENKRHSHSSKFVAINHNELEFCECCGHGTFGSVYRGYWLTQERKEVAIKKINTIDNEVFDS